MVMPVHLYLTDDQDRPLRGSSTVQGREGSIEVIALSHCFSVPVDPQTGNVTGQRTHTPLTIEKEIDCSTPVLHQMLRDSRTLKCAEAVFYRIDHAGKEEAYYTIKLEGVKLGSIMALMPNMKDKRCELFNHMESVELFYDTISWHYHDGNLKATDALKAAREEAV
ncbi:type VI secretion system tube protein TssD [Caballeronia sp. Lep1P3]|uniref:type VI secretion system tube protein TssD n=1 Tax=Caballeronia sp. Lep1P3 TaxID=2878150 RepID=UPI001FD14CD2|nr:type VI secretion system tube protein TssD [Caballeronia sp. Lep1P3]